jgi:hypothetical protein
MHPLSPALSREGRGGCVGLRTSDIHFHNPPKVLTPIAGLPSWVAIGF